MRYTIDERPSYAVLGVEVGAGEEIGAKPGAMMTRSSGIDNEDHLVAWSAGLSLDRRKDGSIKSTMLGGEGFVTEFSGEGHVWLQTRDPITLMAGGGTEHEDDGGAGEPSGDDFI